MKKSANAKQPRNGRLKRAADPPRTRRAGQAPKTSARRVAKNHVTTPSGNVFADLGFSPEKAENFRIRSDLMSELQRRVAGMTQTEAAAQLGVSQPRISELARDQIDRFTIDSLINMLACAGVRVRVSIDTAGKRISHRPVDWGQK